MIESFRLNALLNQKSYEDARSFMWPAAVARRVARHSRALRAELTDLAVQPKYERWRQSLCAELQHLADLKANFAAGQNLFARNHLLDSLIDLWAKRGRAVASSTSAGATSGPLVRFLVACCADIFPLSADAAREYVRGLKNPLRKKRKRNNRMAMGRTRPKK